MSRSFSLGREGEAQWERLRAAYVLSQRRGEFALVVADSQDVRDEVRRRLQTLASRSKRIEPGDGVVEAIQGLARSKPEGDPIPVAWVEARAGGLTPHDDQRWLEALVALNQGRDEIQAQGPCHVVLAGPRTLQGLVARRAPDLSSFISTTLVLDETLEALPEAGAVVTWLHLSDLHVSHENWQQDVVLSALVRDLPGLLTERSLRPDVLFVTGDVANKARKEEYDGAFVVLEQITGLLGLARREHVMMVPGNHDVERGKVGRLAARDHDSLNAIVSSDKLRDATGELLGDAKQFVLYGERLGEWSAFTERFLGPARSVSLERPWRADVLQIGGLSVGVLSLCTAWTCGKDGEVGKLLLGERQLRDMLAEVRSGGARLTIALMHHPLNWLHPEEHSAIRGLLEREVDVVLHGHVHDAHAAATIAAGSTLVTIAAGATYAGLGQDRHHGFSVGRLDTQSQRLEVHHFTWSTGSERWCAHPQAPGADNAGVVVLPLRSLVLRTDAANSPDAREVLATRLRNAAVKVYATVDFAGLRAGGPRNVTLDQIFVPLHVTADGLMGADPRWFVPEEDDGLGDGEKEDSDAGEYRSGRIDLAGLEALLTERRGPSSSDVQFARLLGARRAVILGDPGSGKSTLAKYLACATAHSADGSVPLLLTARDWVAHGKREGLLEMAARQATEVLSVRTDAKALDDLCERGLVLLIVDGVDEAADPEVRRDLRELVMDFANDRPEVSVLVTSRIAGYGDVPFGDFDELTLEAFDDAAIEDFAHRWYDIVEDNPSERLRKRADLLHALEVEPRAKELARNPLLATLIAMVHFSHAQLPGDRAKLYGMMVELLLVTWPAERQRELSGLHGTEQQPMLEKLALRLQERRAEILKSGHNPEKAEALVHVLILEKMLAELLRERFSERTPNDLQQLAQRWCAWLVHDSGLLQEHQPGRVRFVHLTLMEYLAGRALLDRSLSRGYEAVAAVVVERYRDPAWRETLLLMLGSENKKRELGRTVLNLLLLVEHDGATPSWEACVFGLAMLREEVDAGDLRERLLEATCDAAFETPSDKWINATKRLADVVQFGRTHSQSVRRCFIQQFESAEGGRLCGALALASQLFSKDEVEARLAARGDISTIILTLLDLGPEQVAGAWARRHSPRDVGFSWARGTPLEGVLARSFEGPAHANDAEAQWVDAAWIPSLLSRSAWLAHLAGDAAQRLVSSATASTPRRLPEAVLWRRDHDPYVKALIVPSIFGAGARNAERESSPRFVHGFVRARARSHAQGFAGQFARSRQAFRNAPAAALTSDFKLYLARDCAADYSDHLRGFVSRWSRRDFSRDFGPGFAQVMFQSFAMDFAHTFPPGPNFDVARALGRDMPLRMQIRPDSRVNQITPPLLSDLLLAAGSGHERWEVGILYFATMVAESHAALVTTPDDLALDVVSTHAELRIENRRLNIFFTPLVAYATRTRPVADHPNLHALLLTYGLIQYQTTWQWPDCPHWRAWFASPPPPHWLPAHVWHLVRSIQDPADLTHRSRASACLDRSDWPELAQALRDETLIPTPPEILALFDDAPQP